MLFCLAFLHAGFLPAVFTFLIWSLPGAIGMYALSLGAQNIGEKLPGPVYALLSGLNASTVGIIALAAVQLAEKAIKDPLSRILIILGACAGLCYSALWYFPLLMLIGGLMTVLWDDFLAQKVARLRMKASRRRQNRQGLAEESLAGPEVSIPLEEQRVAPHGAHRRVTSAVVRESSSEEQEEIVGTPRDRTTEAQNEEPATTTDIIKYVINIKVGLALTAFFFGRLA